jgi:transcriptional regulator with XRE-family HTH domain
MPKQRDRQWIIRLGKRLRIRRQHLGRTRPVMAKAIGISVNMLARYEQGEAHPSAYILHRMAYLLGTTSSNLLGEDSMHASSSDVDEAVRLLADVHIGAVVRHMRDMPLTDRQSLHAIAATFKSRAHTAPQQVEVMSHDATA